MILTITLVLSILVAFNFFLLFFSCNKTSKKVETRQPRVLKKHNATTKASPSQLPASQLAATGS